MVRRKIPRVPRPDGTPLPTSMLDPEQRGRKANLWKSSFIDAHPQFSQTIYPSSIIVHRESCSKYHFAFVVCQSSCISHRLASGNRHSASIPLHQRCSYVMQQTIPKVRRVERAENRRPGIYTGISLLQPQNLRTNHRSFCYQTWEMVY